MHHMVKRSRISNKKPAQKSSLGLSPSNIVYVFLVMETYIKCLWLCNRNIPYWLPFAEGARTRWRQGICNSETSAEALQSDPSYTNSSANPPRLSLNAVTRFRT